MVDYYDDGRRRRRRSPIQSIDNIDQFRWREVCVLWMPRLFVVWVGCRWDRWLSLAADATLVPSAVAIIDF